jgi:hypothetical protein
VYGDYLPEFWHQRRRYKQVTDVDVVERVVGHGEGGKQGDTVQKAVKRPLYEKVKEHHTITYCTLKLL